MEMKMRHNVRVFVKIVSEIFDVHEPIVEIGSLKVNEYANLRPFFARRRYIGVDMRGYSGVDIIEDAQNLSFKNESIGTIIIVETLEHIQDPIRALQEIHRVLKRNGLVIMTSVMDFPIHNFPSDYWRFTPECFKFLLKDFPLKIIGTEGVPENPHTIFAVAFKSASVGAVKEQFEKLKEMLTIQLRPRSIEGR
jgi:SAM-dependent methyltransferase